MAGPEQAVPFLSWRSASQFKSSTNQQLLSLLQHFLPHVVLQRLGYAHTAIGLLIVL